MAPLILGGIVAAFPWKSRAKALLVSSAIVLILSTLGRIGPGAQYAKDHQALVQARRDLGRTMQQLADGGNIDTQNIPSANDTGNSSDAQEARMLREVTALIVETEQKITENTHKLQALHLGQATSPEPLVSAEEVHNNRASLQKAAELIADDRALVDSYMQKVSSFIDRLPSDRREMERKEFDESYRSNFRVFNARFDNTKVLIERMGQVLIMAQQNLGRWKLKDGKFLVRPGQLQELNRLFADIAACREEDKRLGLEAQNLSNTLRDHAQALIRAR
ncbi:MAG TPA: hypothetical protein VIM98_12335 [Dyella sp.]|uniref:hypothetical protein n=1 Tax=Dyella sp. TaxID=1869338 RepID=UPI002F949919